MGHSALQQSHPVDAVTAAQIGIGHVDGQLLP